MDKKHCNGCVHNRDCICPSCLFRYGCYGLAKRQSTTCYTLYNCRAYRDWVSIITKPLPKLYLSILEREGISKEELIERVREAEEKDGL